MPEGTGHRPAQGQHYHLNVLGMTMNTDRIYQGDDDRWYFNVRGNLAKGPFESHRDAEQALGAHLRQWQKPFANATWSNPLRALRGRRDNTAEARHI